MTINNCNNGQLYNIGVSDSKGVLTLHLFSDDAPSGCSFIEKGESRCMRGSRFPFPASMKC